MASEIVIDLSHFPDEQRDRILGALLASFDDELGVEAAATLRRWADQTEASERDAHSVNPRGRRSAADYRRLADAIDEHRAHLRSRS